MISTSSAFPGVLQVFVESARGQSPYADIYLRHYDVPANAVVDIWTPDHREYRRHRDLPAD